MDVAKLGVVVDPSGARAGITEINSGMMSVAAKAKLAAAGLVAIGAAMVKLGSDFQKASRQIQVDTGATGDALKLLESDFNAVLTTVPNAMGEVAKVLGTLNTSTGLTGTALQGLAKNILDVSRLTGGDATTNANLFGKALNLWGVEVKDNERVLDVLFKATQVYGIELGKLTGDLTTFGPVMQTAGFTIEETADMMGRFSKAGIDWTRIAPGLNAALRNMAKEGVDVEGALRQAFVEIENATGGTERLNVATKLFGAEGAQRLKTAVDAGLTSFENLGKAIMGTEGQIAKMSKSSHTLGEKFGILANKIKVSLEPAASKLLDIVFKLVDNIDILAVALGTAGLIYVLGGAVTALGAMSAATITFQGALILAKIAMGALVGFFTGPLGIALLIGAGVAALYAWVTSSDKAEKSTKTFTKAVKGQTEQVLLSNEAVDIMNKVLADPAPTIASLGFARDRIKANQDEVLEVILNTEAGLAMQRMMIDGEPTKAQLAHFASVDLALDGLREKWVKYGGAIGEIQGKIEDLKNPTKEATTATTNLGSAVETTTEHEEDAYDIMLKLNPELDTMATALWDLQSAYDAGLISQESFNAQLTALYTTADLVGPAVDGATESVIAMTEEADPFATAWEEATKRIDEAFADAWKGAFSSFKDFADSLMTAFKTLLAELAHQAITKPILVALGFTTSGGAGAGGLTEIFGGGGGDGGFLGGITKLFGGNSISNGLNGIFGNLFPQPEGFIGPPQMPFGGSNLGIGIAGLLGSLFGNKFGGEYGGTAGGIGSGLGFSLGGPIGALLGGGLGTILSTFGGDENENSLLKMWTGDQFNKGGNPEGVGKRPWEEVPGGLIGYGKDGDPNRIQANAPLGALGAGGQHIGNPNDAQISDEDFQAWLSGMGQYFALVATTDQAIIDTLGLSDGKIKEIIAATETMSMTVGEMEAPDALGMIATRYETIFNKIGGLADHVFDSFNTAVDGIDTIELVGATLIVMQTVEDLGGKFALLGSDAEGADEKLGDLGSGFVDLGTDIKGIDETLNMTGGEIDDFASGMSVLDTELGKVVEGTNSVGGEIDDLAGGMDILNTNLEKVEGSTSDTGVEISDFAGDMDILDTSLEAIEGEASAVGTGIDDVAGGMKILYTELENVESKAIYAGEEIGGFTGELDTLNGQLEIVDGGVTTLSTDLGVVDTAVDTLGGDLGTIDTQFGKVNTAVVELEKELNQTDGTLGKVDAELGKVDDALEDVGLELNIVNTEAGELSTGLDDLGEDIDAVEGQTGDMETGFDTLGQGMINMSLAMVKATDDISLIDATALTAAFVRSIVIMGDLFENFEIDVLLKTATMWGAWNTMTDQTWDLVRAFDASARSTTNLIVGMEAQYAATMQMLFAIDQYKANIKTMARDLKETLTLDVIGINKGDEGKVDYLGEKIARQLAGLSSRTDPDMIMQDYNEILGNINTRWGLLSDSEKRENYQWYIDQIEEAERLTKGRLDAAEDIIEARHNRLVNAITDGFNSIGLVDLGPASAQFETSVGDFNSGASDILTASANMIAAAGTMTAAANAMHRNSTEVG